MRRRPVVGPAPDTAAGWVVLLTGLLVTVAGVAPASADTPSGESASTTVTAAEVTGSTTTTDLANSATTTTTGPASSATTTIEPATTATTVLQPASTTTMASTGLAGSTTTASSTSTMIPATTPEPAPVRGVLSISAPGLTDLGSDATHARTLSGRLGTVTVTDTREVLDGSWTVSVSATTFSGGHRSPNQQLPPSAIAYWSGPVSSSTGTATLLPGQPRPGDAVLLTRTQTAFSAMAVTGINTASWNPTIVIRIPSVAVAGHYSGAIIHSVA